MDCDRDDKNHERTQICDRDIDFDIDDIWQLDQI